MPQLKAVLAGLRTSCSYLCPSFPLIRVACLEVNWADCPPCPQLELWLLFVTKQLQRIQPGPCKQLLWCPGARQEPEKRMHRLSRALLPAQRCMEVVQSCRDGELWWDAGCPGPFMPTSGQKSLERSKAPLSCSSQCSFPTGDPVANAGSIPMGSPGKTHSPGV